MDSSGPEPCSDQVVSPIARHWLRAGERYLAVHHNEGSQTSPDCRRPWSGLLAQRPWLRGLFPARMLPTVDAWQTGSDMGRPSTYDSERVSHLTRNLPTRRDGRPGGREQMNRSWWPNTSRWMWIFSMTMLAMLGATVALLILMPFRGCKRYALLFGPPTGFVVVTAVGLWLAGRHQIYRFEPTFVAVFSALPTAGLWFLCCKRAYERPDSNQSLVTAEAMRTRRKSW